MKGINMFVSTCPFFTIAFFIMPSFIKPAFSNTRMDFGLLLSHARLYAYNVKVCKKHQQRSVLRLRA